MRPDGTPMSSDSRLALSLRAASSRFRKRPGCATGGIGLSSVIVDDLDVASVAFFKLEKDAPARIHGHRPLMSAIAFELVKPDAPQRAQVLQRRRHIERQQQIY